MGGVILGMIMMMRGGIIRTSSGQCPGSHDRERLWGCGLDLSTRMIGGLFYNSPNALFLVFCALMAIFG